MESKQAFGSALQRLRHVRKLSQEDFSDVSSRTYLSTLERGLKAPTLTKIEDLASVLGIHPLTLLIECYLIKESYQSVDELFSIVNEERKAWNFN